MKETKRTSTYLFHSIIYRSDIPRRVAQKLNNLNCQNETTAVGAAVSDASASATFNTISCDSPPTGLSVSVDASPGVASGSNGLAQGIKEVGNKESSTDTSTANASAGPGVADTSTANTSEEVALGSNGLAQGVEEAGINKELSSDTLSESVNTSAGVASGSNGLAQGIVEEAVNTPAKESSNDNSTANTVAMTIVDSDLITNSSNLQHSGIITTENDAMAVDSVTDSVTNNLEAPTSNLQPSFLVENDKNTTDPAPIANTQNIDSDASSITISGNTVTRKYVAASYVTEATAYFQGISKDDGWVKLVRAWIEFERTCCVRGVSSLIYTKQYVMTHMY